MPKAIYLVLLKKSRYRHTAATVIHLCHLKNWLSGSFTCHKNFILLKKEIIPLRLEQHSIILLLLYGDFVTIVMVSTGTHPVKNHESLFITNESQLKETRSPELKMLGPLCNQTVNLETDVKPLINMHLKQQPQKSLEHNILPKNLQNDWSFFVSYTMPAGRRGNKITGYTVFVMNTLLKRKWSCWDRETGLLYYLK